MEYRIKGNEKEVVHYVELWLDKQTPDGSIKLRARHSSWPEGSTNQILRIYEDGTIKASMNVDETLGFKLDSFKRVRIE